MRTAFVESLIAQAMRDQNIILITGDLGYGVLDEYQRQLPKQFINAGVAEQSMMSMAAGLASTGKRVFVYSIGNFSTARCFEQIRNDVCGMNNSVTVVSVGSGYSYGPQGYSHHAIEDLSIMRTLPNMEIYSPCDAIEADLCVQAIVKSSGPAYLRIGKSGEPKLTENLSSSLTPRLVREGTWGSILFTGSIGINAIKAWEELKKNHRYPNIYSVPHFGSMSSEFLTEISSHGSILTLEENVKAGGFGSLVMERYSELSCGGSVRISSLAATRDQLNLVGSQDFLRQSNGVGPSDVIEKYLALAQE
jgi:transketolase